LDTTGIGLAEGLALAAVPVIQHRVGIGMPKVRPRTIAKDGVRHGVCVCVRV
jgi:hypothetical protein